MRPVLVGAAVGLCVLLAACSTAAGHVDLTIYGAASLRDVLDRAATDYEASTPGTTVIVSTDGSSALEAKIEQGAAADLFLSADAQHAQTLVGKGLADGPAVHFAGNRLVIIVPVDDPAGLRTPADLATPGIKIIAAGEAVPITRYATQVVANLARLPGYPADFATAYATNVVSREDSVKAAVAKIELGEGDAAIVYATDAAASNKVTSIELPTEANVVATYAGVVLKGSAARESAHAFLDWFAGPDGQAILTGFGFLSPP